jgi:aryl carrier-like protein
MHFVPSMLGAFLEHVARRGTAGDFSGLRAVFASGEALSERHAIEFNRLLRPARLSNLYGPTEATIDVSYYDVPERDVPGNVPIGKPIDNIELLIVGPSGKLQPIGVPGELWIAGVGLSRGYLNRPELTRERFVAHPCRHGERAYRTGDRARWLPNGEIEFLGRLDFQVKLRGHRIETGEIENAIRELSGVRDASVLLVGADSATPALAAYYVADREQSIREALANTLPDYMVPSFVRRLDAFPVTANGKLDRAALPAPDPGAEKRELVLPATPDEHVIAAVWRELLPGIEFGVTDDFFALGGDSIKAILLAARLRSRGFSLEVADVFRHPTIRALAPGQARRANDTAAEYERFSLLAPEDEARVLALGADGAIVDAHPLLPQHEQVLAQNLVASRRGISVHRYEFDVEGELDVQALGAAWSAVLARHEVLRSSFLWRRVSTPLALIHAEVDAPLAVHDLSDLDAAGRRAAERALFESERAATRPDRPPLVRLVLAKLGPARSKLWLFVQNSLFDAWSAGNLRRDLLVAYARIRSGSDPGLAPSVAFGSFVAWVRSRDTSEAKRFWSQHLARAGAVSTEIAPRSDRFEGAEAELALRAPATEALVRFARRHGMPLNVLAHAVWAVSFARRAAASDVIIGTVTSGRPAALAGVEDIVGLLATVLPVRIHLPADAAMRDWLEQVGGALLSVREHEHTDLQAIAAYSGADVRALQHALHTRTLVFLNAPHANERLPASEGLRIEPRGVEAYVDVPLRAYVTPGEELRYKIRFDRSSVSESSVRAKLALILELLETLPRAETLADWLRRERKIPREQEL